jgi:replication factor C subunit 3/5
VTAFLLSLGCAFSLALTLAHSWCCLVQASTGDLPHLLFYGPSGAGKKTRVMALLREIFGKGVEQVRLEHRDFKTPSNRAIELTTLASNYHIEMNPSDAGNADRYVVQEVIKEIAMYNINSITSAAPGQLDSAGSGGGGGGGGSSSSSSSSSSAMETEAEHKGKASPTFKVVFLSDCDALTKDAQHGLRRTMEKYVKTCRLILCCENLSKVIEPLRSRCLSIRVPAPAHEEVCAVLSAVAKKESAPLPPAVVAQVATASGRNLRRALLMAEAARVAEGAGEGAKVTLPDWELYVKELAGKITAQQTPQSLLDARNYLYELLGNCIPPSAIFQQLVKNLLPILDDPLKHETLHWAAHYEHRLQKGDKDIYHLEAFVAKFMVLYKDYLIQTFC